MGDQEVAVDDPGGQTGGDRPGPRAVLGAGAPRTETSGPLAGDFDVRVVTEGNVVVVVWNDRRADAPGYYARRFTCEPVAGE